MRSAAVDANQAEIVKALRKCGCTVTLLHRVGKGCPDLLVGSRGVNVLMEVKDGAKPFSERGLTSAQVDWHRDWRGQVAIVTSWQEAVAYVAEYVR